MRWFVDLFQGNLPKTDLEEVDWVTEARLSLREARGSVILLLTHGFTRPKPSGEDLQMLQRIVDARGSEGLTGAIVTFWNKDRNEAEASRLAKSLREDLDYFKVSVPAGLLPSTLMRSLFPRSCGGTCVVVDRDGKFVWETMLRSSLPAEANLTRMVLDRCVGRPISPGWDRAR